jgi:hypothetical protein
MYRLPYGDTTTSKTGPAAAWASKAIAQFLPAFRRESISLEESRFAPALDGVQQIALNLVAIDATVCGQRGQGRHARPAIRR